MKPTAMSPAENAAALKVEYAPMVEETSPSALKDEGGRPVLSSVTNALRALEYLVEAGETGVSEVGRQVGVTVGTSHRLLGTLVAAGFAEQNRSNRKYRPTRKLVAMAEKLKTGLSTREIAHRYEVELMTAVGETVNLAVLDDGAVLYVDKVTSDRPFGVEAKVGSRLPAYCTALGKVLLANAEEQAQAEYLEGLRRGQRSDAPAPPTVTELRKIIKKARADGYALDLGEYLPDVYCVAAPVRGRDDEVVAAISISAPRSRFEHNREKLVEHVRDAAGSLSETLSGLGLPQRREELLPDRMA